VGAVRGVTLYRCTIHIRRGWWAAGGGGRFTGAYVRIFDPPTPRPHTSPPDLVTSRGDDDPARRSASPNQKQATAKRFPPCPRLTHERALVEAHTSRRPGRFATHIPAPGNTRENVALK